MTVRDDLDILDVTLRDGSYLIDFQFTAEETAVMAAALEAAGLRWIELGHGVGLGASRTVNPPAAATDEEYLEAAASSIRTANWGMFFIPGVGTEDDLRLAARYSMRFVRIGTNVTQSEQARPYIELARSLGMFVCYNAMKSYAVSPAEFARRAAEAASCGANVVCLVDSAGSFDGDTVADYIRATQDATDAGIGFHAHDNLSMAVANSLRAAQEGATLVDASLQGMGRSAGNAIEEVLIGLLQQRGAVEHINLKAAMDVGHGLIRPLLGRRGIDPVAVTAGLARFHSSFMPKVASYAKKHRVDVRDLIVRLCQEDQVSAPDDLLEELGRELASHASEAPLAIPAYNARVATSPTSSDSLATLVRDLRSRATKSGKQATLNVVRTPADANEFAVSGNVQSSASHIIGVVTVATPAQLDAVLAVADGVVDIIVMDVDPTPAFARASRPALQKTTLLTYRDSDVWTRAVEQQVVRLGGEWLDATLIVIFGDHAKSRAAAERFRARGADVQIVADDARRDSASHVSQAAIIVAWPDRDAALSEEDVQAFRGRFVLDATIGGISAEGLNRVRAAGSELVRVNVWPELTAAIESAHEFARIRDEALGRGELAGVGVVSGGAVGGDGDVVVDSVRNPTRVIGIADGRGGIVFAPRREEESSRVQRVREAIYQNLVAARFDERL